MEAVTNYINVSKLCRDEPHYGDQPFAPYGGGGMAHHGGAWGHPNVDMQQMQPPQDARQQRQVVLCNILHNFKVVMRV